MKKKKLKKRIRKLESEVRRLQGTERSYKRIKEKYQILVYKPYSIKARYIRLEQKADDGLNLRIEEEIFLGSVAASTTTKGIWRHIESETD